MTIKDFLQKYGTHGPRLIVGRVVDYTTPDQQLITELMDDLQKALLNTADKIKAEARPFNG